MSFLGNIVKSIGTAPPPPPKPPSRPSSANTDRTAANTGKTGARPLFQQTASSLSGTKRKAEDDAVNANGKASKPSVGPGPGMENLKASSAPLNAPKPPPGKAPVVPSRSSLTDGTLPVAAAAKPAPAKGSYADLMARAKEAQEQRAQQQVGVIKHRDTVKQKPSKFAERRKQEQEQAKAQKLGNGKQAPQQPSRSASPQKKDDSKDAKVARSAPKPGYKGTLGIGASRKKVHQGPAKKSKFDDYLGTDEEEDSDMADDDDQGGYDSEGSSDMEAGFDDVEVEESRALRQAQDDDARERALENQLKRDKEERRKKLVALSNKRK